MMDFDDELVLVGLVFFFLFALLCRFGYAL